MFPRQFTGLPVHLLRTSQECPALLDENKGLSNGRYGFTPRMTSCAFLCSSKWFYCSTAGRTCLLGCSSIWDAFMLPFRDDLRERWACVRWLACAAKVSAITFWRQCEEMDLRWAFEVPVMISWALRKGWASFTSQCFEYFLNVCKFSCTPLIKMKALCQEMTLGYRDLGEKK